MKKIQPILLSALLTLPAAAFAQDLPASINTLNQPNPEIIAAQQADMQNMGSGSMENMNHDMSGMKDMKNMNGMEENAGHSSHAQSGPPVGSLPSSDGSTKKTYADYDINVHMDDNALISKLMLDKLEYAHGKSDSLVWDGRYRLGRDLNQLWIRSEGQRSKGKIQDAEAELLWGHTYAPYWTMMTGVRHDFGVGPSRDWAAFGVQGLAPYLFDIEATAYVGSSGRTALKLKTSYDLLLVQRLFLSPELDANLYGKDDPARGVGSGLSDASVGVRLRYEIRREFAPYIGFNYARKFGKTADISRTEGESVHDFQLVTGVRIWF
ncbi:MAG: copper resistance protein B [Sulfuriferula sp.]